MCKIKKGHGTGVYVCLMCYLNEMKSASDWFGSQVTK